MSVPFSTTPANSKVPFVFVEFDSSQAIQGNTAVIFKSLLIGQKTAAGTLAALTPTLVTSAAQVAQLAGVGSQLHNMAQAYFANNTSTETWIVAITDGGAHVAATSTIVTAGTSSAAGTLAIYVAGRKVEVGVTLSMASTAVATAIAAAINAKTELPVTAAAATSTVTLTAKNKGLVGNALDVRFNIAPEDVTPTGLTMSTTVPTNGSGVPDLTTVWAVIDDTQYQVMAMPYTDSASLNAADVELDDRFGPIRQQSGLMMVAVNDTYSNLVTLGNTRNNKSVSIMGTTGMPSLPMELAAALAGVVSFYGEQDPARPFTTLPINFVRGPAKNAAFILSERGILLNNGISTFNLTTTGTMQVERLITTYKLNGFGNPDGAYLDITTPLTLNFLRTDFRNRITTKYPRHKLADDGNRFASGQPVVTPSTMRAECISIFRDWEAAGLVENADQFIDALIVERNLVNRNRLDIRMAPDLVNQLLTIGNLIQFIL